ncbi:MAG: BatA domain-containing protein [Bacteroidales bacterium]|nr:BatA domain-containing protein [Bacteroidales bacterium]
MSFLYPRMLWALAALAIPIAIHLFNFRRHKQVYFSNTALLKTIQQENAKTKRLKYLVTFFLRCLFIVALVLAFAFPVKKESKALVNTDDGVVGIYLDNSMSMKALSSKTTLLEDARESARQLVGQFPPSTRYLLMTNSFEIQNEYPMNREEMLGQLDRMKLDGSPVKMNAVIDRFTMLRHLHGFGPSTLFVYSDFQENMFDLGGVRPDTSLQLVVVPMSAELQSNLSIDTVWLSSPVMQAGLTNELHVRVRNQGDKEVKGLPVSLTMDGKVTASATVDVEGQGTAELVMQFLLQENGATRCSVSVMDYPITFDDAYRFVIETRPTLKVVELNRNAAPSCVSLVFDDDPQYDYSLMDPSRIDLGELAKAQLIVVSEASSLSENQLNALLEDAAEGACVAIFHDDGKSVDTNTMAASSLALQHEFFHDVILEMPQQADLPKVRQHVHIQPATDASVLIRLENGEPLMTERKTDKGRVYDFATTLDGQWSNLADNALFVPLMLKMALVGGGVGRIAYTLGNDQSLLFDDLGPDGLRDLRVRNEDGSFEMMPAHEFRNNRVCVFFQDDLPEAGFYELRKDDVVCHVMAWNDSRLESELRFMDRGKVKKAFEAAGLPVRAVMSTDEFTGKDIAEAMARQSSLWKWWVLLALLALAGEVAVLRFWK